MGGLRQGTIGWATIRDRRGIAKRRPVVVVTADRELQGADRFAVAAITTTFADPTPAHCVDVPWDPQGRSVTRLRRRSAIVCDWIEAVHRDDFSATSGYVPARLMVAVIERIQKLPPPP